MTLLLLSYQVIVSPMAIAAKVSRWISAGLIAGCLVGCNPWTALSQQDRNDRVEVRDIANLSSENLEKEIYLQGKVIQKAPFLGGGAYEIQDATGQIWVITQRPLPETGTEVLIAGQLNFHDLQLQQSNFGELFIQETQALDPTKIQASRPTTLIPSEVIVPEVIVPEETPPEVIPPVVIQPPKQKLDFQFLPHKENQKP